MNKKPDELNNDQKIINYRKPDERNTPSDIASSDQGSLPTHVAQEQKQTKRYRTRNRAKGADLFPPQIPLISEKRYLSAMSPQENKDVQENKDAYMYWIDDSKKLPEIQPLRLLYGVFLLKFPINPETVDFKKISDGWLDQTSTIYLPDYARAIKLKDNKSSDSMKAIVNKISGYRNLMGVVREEKHGSVTYKEYPVIKNFNYDESDNTITFASPYIMRLIWALAAASIARDKEGEPIRYRDGKLKLLPVYSWRLKPEILKEKNYRAVESTGILATLTDRAGDIKKGEKEKVVNIKIFELANRNEELKVAYEKASASKKTRVLKKAIVPSYGMLDKYTDLRKSYKNIKFPNPKDENCIPTAKEMDKVLRITHEGKIRRRGA